MDDKNETSNDNKLPENTAETTPVPVQTPGATISPGAAPITTTEDAAQNAHIAPTPTLPAATPQQRHSMPLMVWVVLLIVVLALVGGAMLYAKSNNKTKAPAKSTATTKTTTAGATGTSKTTQAANSTSYTGTIQTFLTAMENKDKTTADALQSPAFSKYIKSQAPTTSYYSACQSAGQFCTGVYVKSLLANAATQIKDYTAMSGVKGKEEIFTIKFNGKSKTASGAGSSSSTLTLTVATIPSGNSWVVDYVNSASNSSGTSSND
jgi:hypothetical protein